MYGAWNYCDGETQWEQVIDKPKTKTVWFWKVYIKNIWIMPDYMYTEDEIKEQCTHATQFKRSDMLGSEGNQIAYKNGKTLSLEIKRM